MAAPTQEDFVNLISGKIQDFIPFAENLARARFLIYESEIAAPDEKGDAYEREVAEMRAIAEAFRAEIQQSDNSFALNFYMDERNPGGFLEIVDAGMPAPLAGGDEGVSRNPDGSTYLSPTPQWLWDTPVPGYAKPATGVINEIRTILRDMFRQYVNEAIEIAKKEFMVLLKTYVSEIISAATGG